MFLFLDESGDLGFDFSKQGTSHKFIITILICHSKDTNNKIQRAVKRTLRNKLNQRTKQSRIVQELKGSATSLEVKEYFFRQFPTDGWELYSIILNKKRAFDHLKTTHGKKRLYNFLSKELLEKIQFDTNNHSVTLVVDKCKNSQEVKDFNNYIENHLGTLLPLKTQLYINHEDSQSCQGLQAVDMFCWGIAKKHSNKQTQNSTQWYNLFYKKIKEEILYLK